MTATSLSAKRLKEAEAEASITSTAIDCAKDDR